MIFAEKTQIACVYKMIKILCVLYRQYLIFEVFFIHM